MLSQFMVRGTESRRHCCLSVYRARKGEVLGAIAFVEELFIGLGCGTGAAIALLCSHNIGFIDLAYTNTRRGFRGVAPRKLRECLNT